jgi:competence protein ComGF
LLRVSITKAIIKPVVETANKKPVELFRLKKPKRNSKVRKRILEPTLSKLLRSQAIKESSDIIIAAYYSLSIELNRKPDGVM